MVGTALLLLGLVAGAAAIYTFIINSDRNPDAPVDLMGRSMTFNALWLAACTCGISGLAAVLAWPWWTALLSILASIATSSLTQTALEWCCVFFRRQSGG